MAKNVESKPEQKVKAKKKVVKEIPSIPELEKELKRERHRYRYKVVLKGAIYILIIVSAIAVLAAALRLPVFEVYGTSMAPSLNDGDIVISTRDSDLEQGDIVVFYYKNQVLVKRVVATPGEWVNIDEDGLVYVNDHVLSEPYIDDFDLGDCDINLPYQVPQGKFFMMGDNRSVSLDSRNTAIECVAQEQIIGKIEFKVWPFDEIGSVD